MAKLPNLSLEKSHNGLVAGVDEAGRGPWAGPVMAAAVILNGRIPRGLNDSKQLTRLQREQCYEKLMQTAAIGLGTATVEEIDQLNILGATKLAMQRAVTALAQSPSLLLVDGNQLPSFSCPAQAIVGGDGKSLSIAAASIIAKVERDRLMCDLHEKNPVYGWNSNAGYGTKAHQDGIAKFGITDHHRRSFAPIRAYLSAEKKSA